MRLLLVTMLAATAAAAQQQDFSKVEIKAEKVAGSVWMLTGKGGNIGVSVGEDGVAIVDDQYAPLAEKIHAALKKLSPKPVRFVINTHWHGDHTGSNPFFSEGATILAHANVRKRLESGGKSPWGETPPAPKAALPLVTFEHGMSLWWNGEEIRAINPGIGHTDGDTILWFTKSNVIHMGDDYFNGMFPFVDIYSGGSPAKLIETLDVVLGQIPQDAKVIPGHGPLSNVPELRKFRAMLEETVGAVRKGLASGKTVEQLQKENILAPWAPWATGFMKPDMYISIIASDPLAKK